MSNPATDVKDKVRFRDGIYEFLSKRKVLILITILPPVAVFAFVNVVPIVWAVVASFFEIGAFSPVWEWTGTTNYENVLADGEFWMSLWRSLIFAAGSVAFQLVVGIGIALLINREFKFVRLVRSLIMLPYLIPSAVLGFMALWMGNSQFGIINQVLVDLGLIQDYVPWYGSLDLAMISVIITNSWKFSIFVTIMVLARLQSIPDGLYEAATVAGATHYQKFRDITLPNLKGIIFIIVLLRGTWMFNKFDIIWVLTKGGPASKTSTLPIYAYKTAFETQQLGQAAAVSALGFILLIAVALVYFRTLEPSQEVRAE